LSFSKAVLWKDRELSIPLDIMQQILDKSCPVMKFVDMHKEEVWTFQTEKVKNVMYKKQVGQETQYYFSIDIKDIPEKITVQRKTEGEMIPSDVKIKLLEAFKKLQIKSSRIPTRLG